MLPIQPGCREFIFNTRLIPRTRPYPSHWARFVDNTRTWMDSPFLSWMPDRISCVILASVHDSGCRDLIVSEAVGAKNAPGGRPNETREVPRVLCKHPGHGNPMQAVDPNNGNKTILVCIHLVKEMFIGDLRIRCSEPSEREGDDEDRDWSYVHNYYLRSVIRCGESILVWVLY